jgi:hypothetical protein
MPQWARISLLIGLGLIALAFVSNSNAFDVNFSWTPPTQRADGTALSNGELTGYRIYGVSGSSSYSLIQAVVGGATNTARVTIADPAVGACATYYFAMTAVSNLESQLSTTVALPVCPPKGVGSFSAQYQIIFIGK